ncbi:unnamed protein product [Effrenium voratum]|nr:unnamed protein product [Effrenium voratum]
MRGARMSGSHELWQAATGRPGGAGNDLRCRKLPGPAASDRGPHRSGKCAGLLRECGAGPSPGPAECRRLDHWRLRHAAGARGRGAEAEGSPTDSAPEERPRVRMYDFLCDTLFQIPMRPVGPEVIVPDFRDLHGQLVTPQWMEADFSGWKEGELPRPKPVFAANRYPYQLPERPASHALQRAAQHWLLWYCHYPWEEVPDFPDDQIDEDVRREIQLVATANGFKKVDYIWYRNPSASVPDLFHVQVFWIVPEEAEALAPAAMPDVAF